MKKYLTSIILCVVSLFSFQSCYTPTYASSQVEIVDDNFGSDVNFNVIINYGVPYYHEGILSYYRYNNIYYYPFVYNNRWYFRSYPRFIGYRPDYRLWRPRYENRYYNLEPYRYQRPYYRRRYTPYRNYNQGRYRPYYQQNNRFNRPFNRDNGNRRFGGHR